MWDASYVSPHATYTSSADAAALWRRCRFYPPVDRDTFVNSNSAVSDDVETHVVRQEASDAEMGTNDSVFFPGRFVPVCVFVVPRKAYAIYFLLHPAGPHSGSFSALCCPFLGRNRTAPSYDTPHIYARNIKNPDVTEDPALSLSSSATTSASGPADGDIRAESEQP